MQITVLAAGIDFYGYFALAAVGITLTIAYFLAIFFSFRFMGNFKKKIKNQSEKVNIIIYQKFEILSTLSQELDSYIRDDSRLKHLKKEEIKNYMSLSPKEFSDAYSISNQLAARAQKIYVSNEFNGRQRVIDQLLESLYDLDNKYFESIQIYNSFAIGYNYWRNLFSTRWIKNILKIKKIDLIA
ncbi:MAG: hypothetical protein J6X03_04065 [Bacilli bacterium]|nr:hypothetical protein [Bacilli bacterium]